MNKPIIIKIPVNSNFCEQEFMEFVYEYFNGFELEYTIENGFYKLTICREDFLYCEDFDKVLQQIDIEKDNINNYFCIGKKSSIFFSDAWFYYDVVNFLSTQNKNMDNIVIIHIDDHKDMMDPFIGYYKNEYVNLLTQKKVDLLNKSDVFDLIYSGTITIGSMMTPIIFGLEKVKIIHLSNISEDFPVFSVNKTTISDELFKNKKRLHLEMTPALLGKEVYYNITKPNEIVNYIGSSNLVLLHFDMDYFNNRYNGSSDWQSGDGHHNPNLEEQFIMIDNITEALRKVLNMSNIVHTAIGVSPSFYPSEYWVSGIKYLLDSLDSININVEEVKNELIDKRWLI